MSTLADGRWHPGIGDPNLTGWVTVAAYAAAVLGCAVCAVREPAGDRRRFAWATLALALAFLGVSRELDLHTWLTQMGRQLARAEGWYAVRRTVQALFIVGIAGAGVAGLSSLLYLLRALGNELRWAAFGVLFLGVFGLIRATSFHDLDQLFANQVSGVLRLSALLEMTGIGIVAGAAAARLLRRIAGRVRTATD